MTIVVPPAAQDDGASSPQTRSWGQPWPYLAVFALALVSRLLFTGKILYHWDSVNVALGMRDFDIAQQQPQPPGYILYVALARAVDTLFNDPQSTLVLISVISSALAAVAIFALAREMLPRYGDNAGWIAALLLIGSPLIWFYGEIALPHPVDLFLVTLLALIAWRVRGGNQNLLLWGAVLLALAGGVRQQTLLFMLPLIVWSVLRVPLRKMIVPAALLALLTLLWLVPLFMSVGGPANYISITNDYSHVFFDPTSVFSHGGFVGLWRNSAKLVLYTLYGLGFACLPLGLWLAWLLFNRPGARRPLLAARPATLPQGGISAAGTDVNVNSKAGGADLALRANVTLFSLAQRLIARSEPLLERAPGSYRERLLSNRTPFVAGGLTADRLIFLTLWIVPAAAFYALIHMGQPGLVFTFLPALLIAACAALLATAERLPRLNPRLALLVTLVLTLLNGAVFILAPEFPLGPGYSRVLSSSTIQNHDHWFAARIAAIKADYPPQDALLLARDSRIFSYYLPGYTIVRAPAPPMGTDPLLEPADFSTHTLDRQSAGLGSGGAWWVLLPDDHWQRIETGGAKHIVALPDGPFTALEVPAGGRIEFSGVAIAVVSP